MASFLRRCHECGQPVGTKDRFCPRCGAKLPREPKVSNFLKIARRAPGRPTSQPE